MKYFEHCLNYLKFLNEYFLKKIEYDNKIIRVIMQIGPIIMSKLSPFGYS